MMWLKRITSKYMEKCNWGINRFRSIIMKSSAHFDSDWKWISSQKIASFQSLEGFNRNWLARWPSLLRFISSFTCLLLSCQQKRNQGRKQTKSRTMLFGEPANSKVDPVLPLPPRPILISCQLQPNTNYTTCNEMCPFWFPLEVALSDDLQIQFPSMHDIISNANGRETPLKCK